MNRTDDSKSSGVFTQDGYRCRLEWGRRGAQAAAARGDILVIVDVLRFTTTVATAASAGGEVYPCAESDDVPAAAVRLEGIAAVKKPAPGAITLSPQSVAGIAPGTRIVMASLNGATCSRLAVNVPHLFAGALVNAPAVAAAASEILAAQPDLDLTVVACGERWNDPHEEGSLRFAIEDYLGAGAILSLVPFAKSPEASLCASAFSSAKESLRELLLDCASGRELVARDQHDDVLHAAQYGIYDTVPALGDEGWFSARK